MKPGERPEARRLFALATGFPGQLFPFPRLFPVILLTFRPAFPPSTTYRLSRSLLTRAGPQASAAIFGLPPAGPALLNAWLFGIAIVVSGSFARRSPPPRRNVAIGPGQSKATGIPPRTGTRRPPGHNHRPGREPRCPGGRPGGSGPSRPSSRRNLSGATRRAPESGQRPGESRLGKADGL
jgi:hypothetical protein